MNLYDTINNRKSIRTYQNKPITQTDLEIIKEIIFSHQSLMGPFNHTFDFQITSNQKQDKDNQKVGTYGVLKYVPNFITGKSNQDLQSLVDYGYVFEHLILSLTKKGFGTCWLGGTFKRKDISKTLDTGEVIPAITPVGYTAVKKSLTERLVRKIASANNRFDFDKLFFGPNFTALLDVSSKLKDCLTLIQNGPSASNKQPWRVLVDLELKFVHFYLERTPHYASLLNYDIQALDIGIAIAHFEIGLNHHGISANQMTSLSYPTKEGLDYILSFELED